MKNKCIFRTLDLPVLLRFSFLTRWNLKQNRVEGGRRGRRRRFGTTVSIGYFGDFIILFRDNRTVFSRFAHIELRTINDWWTASPRVRASTRPTSRVFYVNRILGCSILRDSLCQFYVHALDQVYSYRIRINERSNERATTKVERAFG